MKKVQQKLKWLGIGSTAIVLLAATSLSAEDWEYQSSESWHSEEWYDPSDWFDEDAYDYESDTDLMSDSDYWDNNGLWSDDYDYDSTVNNSYDYGDGNSYTWDDNNNEWAASSDYSPYTYSYDPASYMVVYSTSSNQSSNEQESNMKKNERSVKQRTLQGEVVAFRHMDLQAKNDQKRTYTVTKIKLDRGQHVVVNLGEKQRLDSLNLEAGDQVKITGIQGKVDGQPLFIANKLYTNERSFEVNRAFSDLNLKDRNQQKSLKQMKNSDGMAKCEGTVEAFRSTRIAGADSDRTLALLRLENGRAMTVDLGDSRSVSGLDIDRGDNVRLKGDVVKVEGKHIFKADKIWINGERQVASR